MRSASGRSFFWQSYGPCPLSAGYRSILSEQVSRCTAGVDPASSPVPGRRRYGSCPTGSVAVAGEPLFSFYAFRRPTWVHLRTSYPINPPTPRCGCGPSGRRAAVAGSAPVTMVWRLALEAEKTGGRLMGFKLIPLVKAGREFVDEELTQAAA